MKAELYNFNTKITKEEHDILRELKDKYAVNIAQAFKLFLKEYHEKMKRFNDEKCDKKV
jgi:hypothetical protein